MKKEMSSFDVRSIVTEMAALEGAHMDKIYHWGAGNVLFRLNVQGEGKKELFFKDKKWLYCPAVKPETPTLPTSFASFLRKYIDNARVGKVRQVGFDRIVEMELSKSDGDYRLIFEMFGGGNVLLVKDGTILNCLIQKTWKDRKTRPGEPYIMPKTRFDPTDSSEEDFLRSFRASDSDCVRTLATSVNLGGQYAEEVCKRVGIDKSTPVSQVDDGTVSRMYSVMKDIVSHVVADPEPTAFLKDGQIQDLAPIDMMSHEDLDKQRYESMSKLIDAFLVQIQEDEEEAFVDPRVEKLNKRIAKQEETLEEYREQCEVYRRKAEALYTDYAKVSELLSVLSEQSAKLTWDKLREGASKIPFVTSIDPSKSTVTGTFAGETVTLDYTKNIDANASDLYQKGKAVGEKAKNAETALNESRAELAKLEKGIAKVKAEMAGKAQPTKQFWFERYKWFITTGGRLVIAGRDAHTNDNVVKKHLKEGDLYEGGRPVRPCGCARCAVGHHQGRREGIRRGAQRGLPVRPGAVQVVDRRPRRGNGLLGISRPGQQDPQPRRVRPPRSVHHPRKEELRTPPAPGARDRRDILSERQEGHVRARVVLREIGQISGDQAREEDRTHVQRAGEALRRPRGGGLQDPPAG